MSANDSEHAQRSGQQSGQRSREQTRQRSAQPSAQPSTQRTPRRSADKRASRHSAAATAPALALTTEAQPSAETQPARNAAGRRPPEPSEPPDDLREAVWALHLRGVTQRQIALRLSLNRKVVARLLNECERELAAERRARLKRRLEGTVARLRRIQAQAWDDHDEGEAAHRSDHMRIVLDAEKEIARLEGLYASDTPDLVAVLFSVERVIGGVVVKPAQQGQPYAAGAAEDTVEAGEAIEAEDTVEAGGGEDDHD